MLNNHRVVGLEMAKFMYSRGKNIPHWFIPLQNGFFKEDASKNFRFADSDLVYSPAQYFCSQCFG